MKKTPLVLLLFVCALCACNKNSNNYSITDFTAGMITERLWSGQIYGYAKGDTLYQPTDTVLTEWPKVYNRTLTDTSFTIIKINGFAVNIMGTTLGYKTTDAMAKVRKYDSVVTGSLDAVLLYYYEKDSLSFVCHRTKEYNSLANQYYQEHILLHTK